MSEIIAAAIKDHSIPTDDRPSKPIKIGYRHYGVRPITADEYEREQIWGQCCREVKGEPYIRCVFDGTPRAANTMIHEILHALYLEYTIRVHDDNEERVVNTFADGLSAVWTDNPEWFAWLGTQFARIQP